MDDQLGLFRPILRSVQWEKLPPDTRQEVTALLVELLRRASPGDEQDHTEMRETNDE
jgi:predicted Fe-S protein YdhL (DUF1289 family)